MDAVATTVNPKESEDKGMINYNMTNTEAINRITDMATTLQIPPTSGQGQALIIAIEAIKQTRWIPVTEKLPEENGWYQCTVILIALPHTMDLFYKNGK